MNGYWEDIIDRCLVFLQQLPGTVSSSAVCFMTGVFLEKLVPSCKIRNQLFWNSTCLNRSSGGDNWSVLTKCKKCPISFFFFFIFVFNYGVLTSSQQVENCSTRQVSDVGVTQIVPARAGAVLSCTAHSTLLWRHAEITTENQLTKV